MKPKRTSYEYGYQYQITQAEKYNNRENNHWKYRVELANTLVDEGVKNMSGTPEQMNLLDVGCSIGTFAIEFSKRGYNCFGVDFDCPALDMASEIAEKEGVTPKFICGDVSRDMNELPPIDIAVCFDVFEHLHDDELGSLLTGIKRQLSKQGILVFHTYPTQEDHIFHGKLYLAAPLLILSRLPPRYFVRIAKAYSSLIDVFLVLIKGKTHKQLIKRNSHCNLLSSERLKDIFRRSGWDLIAIRTGNIYPQRIGRASWFKKHSIADRNLYGIAQPIAKT